MGTIKVCKTKIKEEKNRALSNQDIKSDWYRAIISSAMEGFSLLNLDGGIIDVNNAFCNMLGYSRDELLSMNIKDIDIQFIKSPEVFPPKIAKAKEAGGSLFEALHKRKDGKIIDVLVSLKYLDTGKDLFFCFHRDITEQNKIKNMLESERIHYQSIFENAPVAIWEDDYSIFKRRIDILQADGVEDVDKYWDSHPNEFLALLQKIKVTSVNKEGLRLFNLSKKEDLEGYPYYMTDEPRARDPNLYNRTKRRIKLNIKLFLKGVNKFDFEWHWEDNNKKKSYYLAHTALIKGFEATWSRVITSFISTTKLKDAEKELRRYRDYLEQIVEERTQELRESRNNERALLQIERDIRKKLQAELEKRVFYTNALVHELKTPITPMLVMAEILVKQLKSELQPIMQNLYDGAVALNKRIDELLDISRGEIGILDIKPQSCNGTELIKGVTKEMSYLFENRHQTLIVNISESVGSIINVDPQRTRQILINLLDNASKFTPKGGSIILRAKTREGGLIVEVEDNGLGIPDNEKVNIFEPYYSLREPYHAHTGIGIGLALAKMLVNLHGGDISVKNAEGRGSIFCLFLPIKNEVEA